jgi:FtsP/CotA-like multicopper oxidase with cupredoxin domain
MVYSLFVVGMKQRIIHAAPTRVIEIELVDPLRACTLVLVARDGIFHPIPYQTVSAVILYPGNRADIVIKCSAVVVDQNITARIFNDPARDGVLGSGNRMQQDILFVLQVKQATGSSVSTRALPTSAVTLPDYLSGLVGLSTTALAAHTVTNIDMQWSDAIGYSINGAQFVGHNASTDIRYLDKLCLNRTYEFTAVAEHGMMMMMMSAHPLHIHTNPFQIVGVNGLDMSLPGAVDVIRVGEWRDTAPALVPKGITFRMRPTSFVGAVPLHCHIVQHEDLGMMALLSVSVCSAAMSSIHGDLASLASVVIPALFISALCSHQFF